VSDIVFDGMVFDRLREIGDQSQWIGGLESEIARLRLTDEEREAVEWASKTLCVGWHDLAAGDKRRTRDAAATLRALLARLSPPAT
jgi:hypothetical protein